MIVRPIWVTTENGVRFREQLKTQTDIRRRKLLEGFLEAGILNVVSPNMRRLPYVIGPRGILITYFDLPPTTGRWIASRKAIVVAAVRGGLLALDDACTRYNLTKEEYMSWERAIDCFGLGGLRTTHLPQYRKKPHAGIAKQDDKVFKRVNQVQL